MIIKKKTKVTFIVVLIFIIFIILVYTLDKVFLPTALAVSEAEMRAKAIQTVDKCILDELNERFRYNDIVRIDKDSNGNIVMLRADTVKLNLLANNVSLKSQEALNRLGSVGIELTLGYITKNNLLSYLGPKIKVKMEPLSNVETNYSSVFESAGINQTMHKIFIKFKTKVRIIFPMKSFDVDLVSELPISETVIVGKIPDTALQLDLDGIGYKSK